MTLDKNLIIVGAGQLGVLTSKIIKKSYNFQIVGFIDNDPRKKGKKLRWLSVNITIYWSKVVRNRV